MNFLAQLLQGIAFVPAVVHGIEGLFGGRPGTDKKQAVMSFVQATLSMTESIASRDIADEAETPALDDLAREPAGNRADDQRDDDARKIHDSPPMMTPDKPIRNSALR